MLSVFGAGRAQEPSLEQQYLDLLRQRRELARANRVLQEEGRLSEEKRPYLVVDLPSKKLAVRVHGVAVKEFSAVELRTLGSLSCVTGLAILARFEEFVPPAVPVGGTENLDLVVELQDMPQSYDLGFQSEAGPVDISIEPASSSATGRFLERVSSAFISGRNTLGRVVGYRRSAYRVLLAPEDAQALYWSLGKGSSAILICE